MATSNLCVIEGCCKRRFGHGLCQMHYMQERRKNAPPCTIPDCTNPTEADGLCIKHLTRLRRYGHPLSLKSTAKGDAEAFVHQAIAYEGDDCLIWPFSRDGQGRAQLRKNGKSARVARLVCELVYGPPPTPLHEVAHGCGKGHLGCIAPRHLRWSTHVDNLADKVIHGTQIRGAQHKLAKLTTEQVLEIRALIGSVSMTQLAQRYGVSVSLISKIHLRKIWNWLE